ncbi:MAG TPA: hypothetical protein VGM52_08015 [Herbaspirillum sp.]
MRKIITSALLCLPLLAHADCKDHLSAWAQQLHPGRTLDADAAICKISPADPTQTFVVLPIAQPDATDDDAVYDVDVLVTNSDTGEIIARIFEPSAITSDAVRLQGIALDTARYQLAPQTRAFGVRTNYEGSSRVAPYSATALDLYVMDGHALRRVVANLTISNSGGEWDGNCAGTFSDSSRTLSVGAAGRNGYATLHVAEKTVGSTSKPAGQDCNTKDSPAKRAGYDMEYDGAQYAVPAKLKYN